MAARSTLIRLENKTSLPLNRTSVKLPHGAWTENSYPPEKIPPGKGGVFQAESDGFMTGDEGTVIYYLVGEGMVTIGWDNPFVGSNSYTQSAPKSFSISHSGGSGDNAEVTFTLTSA